MNSAARARRPSAREKLLDAAIDLIRRQGLTATSVDELCAAAGVTKGAFFHHFESKEALAVAAAAHWSAVTGAQFAAAPYHELADPLERVLGYLDLRASLIRGTASQFSCLAGTMVQEAFESSPAVRDACRDTIFGHAETLEQDFEAAIALYPPREDVTAAGLARYTQTVLQGAFILSKAADDPGMALEGIDHLRRYVRLLFGSEFKGGD